MEKIPSFDNEISVSQLLLDTQNPRLVDTQTNQRDAIRAMVSAQTEKIMSLAQHIVENGINPASLPIVMPSGNDGMFDVLDGNRRVTAIKLLESPLVAEGILNTNSLEKLKALSTKFAKNPITELNCIVVADRDEADTWIQLIHRGQNDGAGLVQWDGQVSARYDARKTGNKSIALQILDFVKENAQLTQDTKNQIDKGKFPITNLERLLNTPYVRKKLGVENQNGTAVITHPPDEVLKGLSRVVDDLGTRRVTVSNIKKQDQRIDYINGFDKNELPEPTKELETAQSLESTPNASQVNANTQKVKGVAKNRLTLIPKDCKLVITGQHHHRIGKIYLELKKLIVDDYPNASAVMMRVFIELSMDYYLTEKIQWPELQIQNSSLAQKLTGVSNYFESTGIMSQEQLAPIRKAAGGQTILAASTKNLNAFVHNRFYSPIPSELKIAWDDIQLFIEKTWST
ncbi:MAG: hypothetical protein KG029_19655 [Bacteroidetes bacterium]|nr:hypothetical protein [Bacteroidota bacterium]